MKAKLTSNNDPANHHEDEQMETPPDRFADGATSGPDPEPDSTGSEPPSGTLREALTRHQIDLPDPQVDQLARYCELLWRWNAKMNLTRHTTYDKFVGRDLLDTMQLSGLLEPDEEVLDIGTGGGVPGVVLAILRPDLPVALCESIQKKSRAVEAIVRDLKLPVTVHHDRAESVLGDLRFDAVVARAIGPLWKICKWLQPHWHSFGRLLAIKGPQWVEERKEARKRGLLNNIELRRVASYRMPGTESESVILKLWARKPGEPPADSG
jgi:16S rRNA (guanine527-N7)-methyltransferase